MESVQNPTSNGAVLKIRGLRTVFQLDGQRELAAVDGVDIDLGRSEVLGLVGESGSGKSVLALSVLGLIDPPGRIVNGEVIFNGTDLLQLSEAERRRHRGSGIGMIFQNPVASLNPVRRIGDQLSSVLRLHGSKDPNREALHWLEEVSIADPSRVAASYPHELSGGMCQRAMIALALSCRPQVLIADEPTASLDVTIQAQLMALLRDLQARFEMSILFISHDLGAVAQMCDRVAVMYIGRIVEVAAAGDLYSNPVHPYTKALLASVPIPDPRTKVPLVSLRGELPNSVADHLSSCRFQPRCPEAIPVCLQQDPPLRSVSPGHSVACVHCAGSGVAKNCEKH